MDTTTENEETLETFTSEVNVSDLLAALKTADAVRAPVLGSEIARSLTASLEAVPGATTGEQLQAFKNEDSGED